MMLEKKSKMPKMVFLVGKLSKMGLWISALLLLACSGGSDSGSPHSPDGGDSDITATDIAITDSAAVADAAAGDSLSDGGEDVSANQEVAPPVEPQVIPVTSWRVATLKNPNDPDPVLTAIENGTFVFPETDDAYGLKWSTVRPAEDGTIDSQSWGYLQLLVAKVTPPPTGGIMVQADRTYQVLSGNVRQPGDIYGSGRIRVPIPHSTGADWIVVRALVGTALPKVVLTEWPQEIAFNPADMTAPDWVLGNDEPSYLGLPILNFRDLPVTNLTAIVVENDYFTESQQPAPILGAHTVSQVGFRLVPKKFETAERTIPVRLRLQSPDLLYLYEQEVTIPIVNLDKTNPQAIRQTFVSEMDHSIQFFGLRLPVEYDPVKLYSLVLSLHGAGVEAGGGRPQRILPRNGRFWSRLPTGGPLGLTGKCGGVKTPSRYWRKRKRSLRPTQPVLMLPAIPWGDTEPGKSACCFPIDSRW